MDVGVDMDVDADMYKELDMNAEDYLLLLKLFTALKVKHNHKSFIRYTSLQTCFSFIPVAFLTRLNGTYTVALRIPTENEAAFAASSTDW